MRSKIIWFLMLVTIMTVILSGCQKPNLAVIADADNTVMIKADKAPKGYFGGAGFTAVEEGQKIIIESALNEKGEILVKFSGGSSSDSDADPVELTGSVSGTNAVLEVTVKGPGTTEHEIGAGEYGVYAEVLSKADGIVSISVK